QANVAGRGGAGADVCAEAPDQCTEGKAETKGRVSSCGSGADDGAGYSGEEKVVRAWDPSTGCPSAFQYRAMLALDHQWHWDSIQLTKDGDRCCYRANTSAGEDARSSWVPPR